MEIVRRSFNDDQQPSGRESTPMATSSIPSAAALVLAGFPIQSVRDVNGEKVFVFAADARSTFRRFTDLKREIEKMIQTPVTARKG